MVSTINMQQMRYLNLFEKITRVSTRFCFNYNEAIFFSVPRKLVSKAVGRNGKNVKQISQILGKRVKIVFIPQGIEDVKEFIQLIVSPFTFKEVETKDDEVVLTPGSQSKAALIGRNKRRLLEMKKIIQDFFKRDFRIV